MNNVNMGLDVNSCLSKQVATSSNERGVFKMLNLCFQNTHQMGLEWWVIDLNP